jgi:ADP-heptose:LPS heptosyltransferase
MRLDLSPRSRTLVIQLARLGDLIQTVPVLYALRRHRPETALDLLCAAPLAELVRNTFPVDNVLPWDGAQCRVWADEWNRDPLGATKRLQRYIDSLSPESYGEAYSLNQHERAILAAHLLSKRVRGVGATGPLSAELNVWGDYLRRVARDRAHNRVHLGDAFCGLCGVRPHGYAPLLRKESFDLPADLKGLGQDQADWVAVVVGAGDAERCVPPQIWRLWVEQFLYSYGRGRIVLIGAGGEREAANAIQSSLPSILLGRVWDATGRTSLRQLAHLLSRCVWVIGADTGPLHLATAVGSRAVGFYFARARVHETGPYGRGHWVFQHEGGCVPDEWPIRSSIELILNGSAVPEAKWELWQSELDEWGAFFVRPDGSDNGASQRQHVWEQLSPSLTASNEHA